MPHFTLYNLNPEFWARVQAKAKAEGTTVKAVILRLLTTWLGLLALTLFTVSCTSPYAPTPLTPQTEVVSPGPSPTTPVPVQPLSVALSIGRSAPEVGDNISFVASAGTTLTHADWSFGNGATQSTNDGSTAYAYPAIGTFVVRVTVTASDGRTGSDEETVTVRKRPTTPKPTPDVPTPNTSGFGASLACAPEAAGSATPCHVTVTYNGVVQPSATITSVAWDFGDGQVSATFPVSSNVYAGAGSYTVFATVTANLPTPPGGTDTETVSLAVTIP